MFTLKDPLFKERWSASSKSNWSDQMVCLFRVSRERLFSNQWVGPLIRSDVPITYIP